MRITTPITSEYFHILRDLYKEASVTKISQSLNPLVYAIKFEGYLRGKLRYHPLGFMFTRLFEFENGETIRIHIWLNKDKVQKPLMDIHNHFYNVNSYILVGAVSNTLYEIRENCSPTHAVYEGSYLENEKRVLRKTKNLYCLEKVQSLIIENGNLYTIKKSEIHSGDSLFNKFTVSIVYTEHPGNPTPLVFGPIEGLESYDYSSENVDKAMTMIIEAKIPLPNNK